ncbi:hypothetical protein [uncultured Pontibacter sp.]|uniref:HYC_CC_PP family protein n=1 Tax=uncultured Pontibacter sp. TaxID=453356 RepID=UPI0026159E74|nr:hypothetical protein [uncultured Pontibacter sp.]
MLLLTLSILLGSVGVAFSEQFCLMAGIKTTALAQDMDECCKKPSDPDADTDDCCTERVAFEKLEPVSSLKVFNLQLPVYFPHHIKLFTPQQAVLQASAQLVYTYSDSSPPIYGRKLLHQLHTLLV